VGTTRLGSRKMIEFLPSASLEAIFFQSLFHTKSPDKVNMLILASPKDELAENGGGDFWSMCNNTH
jgi:hypothetical protein